MTEDPVREQRRIFKGDIRDGVVVKGHPGQDGAAVPRPDQGEDHPGVLAGVHLLGGDVLDHPVLDLHRPGGDGIGIAQDELLVVECPLLDGVQVGAGVVPGQDAAQGDLPQFPEDEALLDGQVLPEAEEHLEFVLEKEVEKGAVGDHPEEGVKGGDLLPAPVQDAAEEVQVGLALTPDGQGLDPGVGVVADLGRGQLQLPQDLLGVLQKDGPVGGEGDGPGGAEKELGVQLLLQGADLPGDGGLGDVQSLRRPGEVQILRHLEEALQLLYIQI